MYRYLSKVPREIHHSSRSEYIAELETLSRLSIIYMIFYMLVDRTDIFISSKDYRNIVHSHREINDKYWHLRQRVS